MPESDAPTANIVKLPNRRQGRKPRVLSYRKCRFCRDPKVKSKCIWDDGHWPNKCKRCSEKDLACSKPLDKAEELLADLQAQQPSLPFPNSTEEQIFNEPEGIPGTTLHDFTHTAESTDMSDYLILQLLALRSLALMASEEYVTICETILTPMKHDQVWTQHAAVLYRDCSEYQDFAWGLQKRIDYLAPHSKLAMSAALDLEHFSRVPRHFLDCDEDARTTRHPYTDRIIDEYHRKGHVGIVTVLLLQQFLRFGVIDARLPTFFECRRNFISEIATLLKSDAVEDFAPQEIIALFGDSQLFVPGILLRNSLIKQDYEELGLKDCLGRSVALREYDAGIDGAEKTIRKDPYDCIGRTLLHAACAQNDEAAINTLITRGLICATKTDSGLSPLHIAAMIRLNVFRKLYVYYSQMEDFSFLLSKTDQCGRTFLEWAASCGHDNIFYFLLVRHFFEHGQGRFFDDTNNFWLSQHTVMTVIKLSLIYNHINVLRTLKSFPFKFEMNELQDNQNRTPLWYAAHYRRSDAIRFLAQHGSTNIADQQGLTPLMEAARIGFLDGVRSLLESNFRPGIKPNQWQQIEDGVAAKDLAVKNGHQNCAQVLSGWLLKRDPLNKWYLSAL